MGAQQRAFNLNGEVTFGRIAGDGGSGRQAWKYDYSIPPAFHAADLFGNGWLLDPAQNISPDFA